MAKSADGGPEKVAVGGGAAGWRERTLVAMLRACGALGYRATTVQSVLELAETHRTAFYREFAGKDDCYERAYAAEAERLCAAILRAGAGAEDWRDGLAAALDTLAAYLRADEARARGFFFAVHVARGGAATKHDEVLARLSRTLDCARRELDTRHSPPPLTATFMVRAGEGLVLDSLLGGGAAAFEAALPELEALILDAYLGGESASGLASSKRAIEAI